MKDHLIILFANNEVQDEFNDQKKGYKNQLNPDKIDMMASDYAFCVVNLLEIKNTKLVKIRDALNIQIIHPLSNNALFKGLDNNDHPMLDIDPDQNILTLPFVELSKFFDRIIISELNRYETARIKGKFVQFESMDLPKFNLLYSKFYYQVRI